MHNRNLRLRFSGWRLICGSLYGERSPVRTLSEMFYADVSLDGGAKLPLAADHQERAVYVVNGSIEIADGGGRFEAGGLAAFRPGADVTLRAASSKPARIMLLGGEPLDGKRHIWWNFVSSSPERIDQAKDDWQNGRFAPVPDETDFIPLPDTGHTTVHYP